MSRRRAESGTVPIRSARAPSAPSSIASTASPPRSCGAAVLQVGPALRPVPWPRQTTGVSRPVCSGCARITTVERFSGIGAVRRALHTPSAPSGMEPGGLPVLGPAATPKTRPILCTALLRPPDRIAWIDAPIASGYVVELRIGGRNASFRRSVPSLRLPGRAGGAEVGPVHWSIRPEGDDGPGIGGTFWVLSAAEQELLARTLERLDDVSVPEYRAVVGAIVHAQARLYQDALDILDRLLAQGDSCVTLSAGAINALAHRTCRWVLQSMKAGGAETLSPAARQWIETRLAYHRAAWGTSGSTPTRGGRSVPIREACSRTVAGAPLLPRCP